MILALPVLVTIIVLTVLVLVGRMTILNALVCLAVVAAVLWLLRLL